MTRDDIEKKVYGILTYNSKHKWISILFDIIIILLILFSTVLTLLEATLGEKFKEDKYFEIIEYVVVGLFFVDWLLHFIAASYLYPREKNRLQAKLKWVLSASSIIDIVCLLTLFTNFFPPEDDTRLFKVFKLVKIFKIPEYLWFLPNHYTLVNYHTHTYRCGHAVGEDEEYILAAIKNGYSELGFSEHLPLDDFFHLHEDDHYFVEYYNSLNALREKYKNVIKIFIGFEAEYFSEFDSYYHELLDKYHIDYFILGQHCGFQNGEILNYRNSPNDMFIAEDYIKRVVSGIKSHLFIYVAHPDFIMNAFDIVSDTNLLKKMDNIIIEAKNEKIPLEINLNGVRQNVNFSNKRSERIVFHTSYPYEVFFRRVHNHGNEVILGLDAHNPNIFENSSRDVAINFAHKLDLNLIMRINIKKFYKKNDK